jgi:hypothetical protein
MFGTLKAKLTGEIIIIAALAVGIGYLVGADNFAAVIALSVCAGIMAHMMWMTVLGLQRARQRK